MGFARNDFVAAAGFLPAVWFSWMQRRLVDRTQLSCATRFSNHEARHAREV